MRFPFSVSVEKRRQEKKTLLRDPVYGNKNRLKTGQRNNKAKFEEVRVYDFSTLRSKDNQPCPMKFNRWGVE